VTLTGHVIREGYAHVTSYDFHVPPKIAQFRLDLRMLAGRLKRFIGTRLGLAVPAIIMEGALLWWN
jgi:hypothetical protein